MTIEVGPLRADEQARWAELWRGYLDFYETTLPEARYASTWRRLLDGAEIAGLGARWDGRLVGITHYLFHAHCWYDDVCYLQDLFVDGTARGHGVGRQLIQAVAGIAGARGCSRLYWMTNQANAPARLLYDQIATWKGHIRYDFNGPLA